MMRSVLALESGGAQASVALIRHDGQLTVATAESGQSHSSRLLPLAQELLAQAGLTWRDLDGIAVGIGPGSFTGLRVACGIAQGLALGSDKPLLPVNGVDAYAYIWWCCSTPDDRAAVVNRPSIHFRISFDARLGERFAATVSLVSDTVCGNDRLRIEMVDAPEVVAADLAHATDHQAHTWPMINLRDPNSFEMGDEALPLAAWIARFAVDPRLTHQHHWVGPSELRPLYVRDKVAQTVAERRDGSDLVWAEMTAADVASVMVIEQQAYPFPWTSGNFLDSLNAGYTMRLLKERGVLIGYLIWMQVVDEAHLLNIALSPARQGRGLGAWMMRQLLGQVASAGIDQMLLEVRPSNASAIRLYRKLGFKEIGVRKGYYPNNALDVGHSPRPAGQSQGSPREDAIVMRRLGLRVDFAREKHYA